MLSADSRWGMSPSIHILGLQHSGSYQAAKQHFNSFENAFFRDPSSNRRRQKDRRDAFVNSWTVAWKVG